MEMEQTSMTKLFLYWGIALLILLSYFNFKQTHIINPGFFSLGDGSYSRGYYYGGGGYHK